MPGDGTGKRTARYRLRKRVTVLKVDEDSESFRVVREACEHGKRVPTTGMTAAQFEAALMGRK